MPDDDQPTTIVVETDTHRLFGWILVPVEAYGDQILRMILDTRLLDSFISESMQHRLVGLRFLEETVHGRYTLTNLKIAERPVPDMEVRSHPGLIRAGADGSVGLRYLSLFDKICFERASRLLTLVDP